MLALREWIAPRINPGQVQVTPVSETETIDNTTTTETSEQVNSLPGTPLGRFQIRPEHFAHAIEELKVAIRFRRPSIKIMNVRIVDANA